MKLRISFIFALLLLSAINLSAQDSGILKRVKFETDSRSIRFEGNLEDMLFPDEYLITLKRGQIFRIKLEGKQIVLHLRDPNKKLIELSRKKEVKSLTKTAKISGEYSLILICVAGTSPTYKLNISIQ